MPKRFLSVAMRLAGVTVGIGVRVGWGVGKLVAIIVAVGEGSKVAGEYGIGVNVTAFSSGREVFAKETAVSVPNIVGDTIS